jgi:hypothetical protein
MRTPRLPVIDWTDAPADLNWLVRFAERRNLVSASVPSHFNWPLQLSVSSLSTAAVTGALMHGTFKRPVVTLLFIQFNLLYLFQAWEWSEFLTDAGFLRDKAVVSRDAIKWISLTSLVSFLGAFAELPKSPISFVTCVCPSAWNNSASTGRIFVKFDILLFF